MQEVEFNSNNTNEFLSESNKIEGEYSTEALQDAHQAWTCGVLSITEQDIDLDLILAIHRRLMKRLNKKIAGKIRTLNVQVGGRVCMPHEVVKTHLEELCRQIPKTAEEIKEWHLKFEGIHPFEDGNGRTGRIIMNLQRLKNKLPMLIIHEGTEQFEYYKWFRGCQ